MQVEFTYTNAFKKSIKRISKKQKSLKSDFDGLLKDLMNDPLKGIQVSENLRKIRLAVSSRNEGKSGGCRVYYYVDMKPPAKILFVDILDKREAESLPEHYLKAIIAAYKND